METMQFKVWCGQHEFDRFHSSTAADRQSELLVLVRRRDCLMRVCLDTHSKSQHDRRNHPEASCHIVDAGEFVE